MELAIAAVVTSRLAARPPERRNVTPAGPPCPDDPTADAPPHTVAAADTDLLALDEALQRLGEHDPEQQRIVELRYFGGLTVEETAHVLGRSPRTVKREWQLAKAWLYRELHA
jgi:RNA polymerase sigma factor (sigma-70 family)